MVITPDKFKILLFYILKKDIAYLIQKLNSSDYINRKDRLKLRNAIYLAIVLGYESPSEDVSFNTEQILKEIQKKSTTNHLNKNYRAAIKPYAQFLLDNLEKMTKASLDDDINDISNIFQQKLKITPFDEFLNENGTGLKQNILNILIENGIWRTYPDYEKERFCIWGSKPKDELESSIKDILPMKFIDYTQQNFIEKECRDDCYHMGCVISQSESKIENFRFYQPGKVKDALKRYAKDRFDHSTGTTGIFINDRNSHYIVTAAHVLFPELSDMPLDSSELKTFTTHIDYAIYDTHYDIAMIPLAKGESHANSVQIVSSEFWDSFPHTPEQIIIKIGSKTGITLGNLHQSKETYRHYSNLIRVGSNYLPFAEKGDSGSVYFAQTENGYTPIGIHRTSDTLTLDGLATSFMESFQALLAKKGLNIEDFQACWHNRLSETSCNYYHLKKKNENRSA